MSGMFKKILVPLDGSKMAEAALPAAGFLAEKFGGFITLLHVIEKDAPRQVHGQPHLQDAAAAQSYLNETARHAGLEKILVKTHVHTPGVGNVAQSILAHTSESEHDSVVMCSHGRGRALHLFLGSIAQEVMAMGPVPVLVTRPDKGGKIPSFSCSALLLPLDDEPDHGRALPVSRELARTCGASLHLLRVIPDLSTLSGTEAVKGRFMPGTTARLLELSAHAAEGFLRSRIESLAEAGFEAHAHVLRGNPPDVIVRAAGELGIDLIVLATHGKSGMKAFWAGSVAHHVCGQSRIPLLLIKAGKETLS